MSRLPVALAFSSLLAGCGPQGTNAPEPRDASSQPPASPGPAPAPGPSPSPPPSSPPPPEPSASFVRFVLVGDEAGCPPQARGDCHSSAELLADGTLRLDAWGDPGGGVRQASVPPDAFTAAVQRLTAPEVVRTLSPGRACRDADETESMSLHLGVAEHHARTGACNDAPVQDARGVMIDLCSRLFPQHSLVSPPF